MNKSLAAAILLAPLLLLAQKPFAPVESWKTAVLSGDAASLAKLYAPQAQIKVAGKPSTSDEEAKFWAGLKAGASAQLTARILEANQLPNGDIGTYVRISVVSGASGDSHMMVAGRQTWEHLPEGWKIVAATRGALVQEQPRVLPQPATPNVSLYAEPQEAEAELKAGLAKAAKEHKRLILVFGGNWCYDCHVLDTTFRSKEFAPLVAANYVVVHINIGDEVKDNTDIAARYGVALDKGVPSLGVLNPDGTVVYAQKNGEFESTVKIGPEDVREFLEKWKRSN
jgi:ketosteroid isomerase-like protein